MVLSICWIKKKKSTQRYLRDTFIDFYSLLSLQKWQRSHSWHTVIKEITVTCCHLAPFNKLKPVKLLQPKLFGSICCFLVTHIWWTCSLTALLPWHFSKCFKCDSEKTGKNIHSAARLRTNISLQWQSPSLFSWKSQDLFLNQFTWK